MARQSSTSAECFLGIENPNSIQPRSRRLSAIILWHRTWNACTGPVVRLDTAAEMNRFRPGSVLVTAMTDPDWEPILKHAAAIITDRGGRTCHAAIVSRELGVSCVVGTGNATVVLRDGQPVTVTCAEGETGLVMEGLLPFGKHELRLDQLPATRTKIYINAGNPDQAFDLSFLPVDGVGLAREEFIIAQSIGIHPRHSSRAVNASASTPECRPRCASISSRRSKQSWTAHPVPISSSWAAAAAALSRRGVSEACHNES